MKDLIKKRIGELEKHFEKNKLKSYDPYDGLNTPLRKLLFRNKFLERIWLQTVRLLPVNIRPLLGIKKIVHIKTVSDLLSASSIFYSKTKDEKYFKKAEEYFFLLGEMDLKQNSGIAWGLNFYFTTRFVQADTQTANLFNTINALNSLLDFYDINREKENDSQSFQIEKLLNAALEFILKELGYEESEEIIVWNYWEDLKIPIYNVNALMVGFLARYQKAFKVNKFEKHLSKTIEFLRRGQNENGSWNYSADSTGDFIDGFHTGYIIEGLSIAKLNDAVFNEDFFVKGIKYFLDNFFTAQYLPKYFNTSLYPIDGQNFAQALQTLFHLKRFNLINEEFIGKVLENTDSVLWNEKGYFNCMKTKYFIYRTAMDRWTNAPMYLALAKLS